MVDAGVLGPDDRVELIEGEILVMSPEKSRHAAVVDLVAETLRKVFGAGHTVRVQHPIILGDLSEPGPDVCVVRGGPRDYLDSHPTGAMLVVEVSDSSLAFDRTEKARLYASAGIAEYWIVNLVDGCVEVQRDPMNAGYSTVTRHTAGETLAPLAVSAAEISVQELLP
jgi:Uma2 family endonuclease